MVTVNGVARDARHVPLTRVDRLRQAAAEAAQVRRLSEHPDVVALGVERVRTWTTRLMWTGIGLGLAFTMVNVQTFAADGAPVWSLPWLVAWLLDPMVSLVLVAILLAEQVTARWQVPMRVDYAGPWVRWTKRVAFAATYAMNTWVSWAALDVAGIVLHSVPPIIVICAAEAGPITRDRLTEAVHRAATPTAGADQAWPWAEQQPTGEPVAAGQLAALAGRDTRPAADPTTNSAAAVSAARPKRRRAVKRRKPGRMSRADYVAAALAAYRPGVVVTPAWVREAVPGIGRGTSSGVAADVKAALDSGGQAEAGAA